MTDARAHNEAVMAAFGASRQRLAALEVPDGREVTMLEDIECARPEDVALLLDLYLPANPPVPPPLDSHLRSDPWR